MRAFGRQVVGEIGGKGRSQLLDSPDTGESRHTSAVAPRAGFGLWSLRFSYNHHEVSVHEGRTGARTSTPIIRP